MSIQYFSFIKPRSLIMCLSLVIGKQRTEVVDDASWVTGFLDIFDPALGSIKRLLNMEQNPQFRSSENFDVQPSSLPLGSSEGSSDKNSGSGFDLDEFITTKLSLDPKKLDVRVEVSSKRTWRSMKRTSAALQQPWIWTCLHIYHNVVYRNHDYIYRQNC